MPTLPSQKPAQAGVTLLAVAACVALLYFGRVFFITMVVAITIAFLLDPVVTAFVKLRLPRAVASFIVCSIALLALYLLGLGLYTQFSGFVEELPTYSQRMNDMVDNVATRVDEVEKRTYQVMIPKRFQETPPRQSGSRTGPQTAGKQGAGNRSRRRRFPKSASIPNRRRCSRICTGTCGPFTMCC